MSIPRRTLYDVLGVDPAADEHAIHQAYRVRAMLSHPDRGGDEAAFVELVEAYRVLSDPEQRRAYDTEEGLGGRPWSLPTARARPAGTSASAASASRRWIRAVAGGRAGSAASAALDERTLLGTLGAADEVWVAADTTRLAPVARGDAIVVVPDRGITLLDAATGAVRWRTSTGTAPIAPPAITDARVVVWMAPASLLLLDRVDGEVRGHHQVDHLGPGGLAAADDLVVCARTGGRIDAYPTTTGRARWHATIDTDAALPPLIVGTADDRSRTVVVVGQGREVVGLDARRGRARWRRTLGGPPAQATAVADGTVWIADGDGRVVGLHAADGDDAGEVEVGGSATGLLVDDRAAYVMATDGRGAALHGCPRADLAGGWRLALPEAGPPPIAASSWLTLVEPEGRLTTIEGHHGVVVHECRLPDLPSAHPILALPGVPGGDAVVCTDRRGVVRAVRPRWD